MELPPVVFHEHLLIYKTQFGRAVTYPGALEAGIWVSPARPQLP